MLGPTGPTKQGKETEYRPWNKEAKEARLKGIYG